MQEQQERLCTQCNRVYSWDDWQEDNCPFCDVPLQALEGGEAELLDDTLSQEIPWPQGQREVEVYRAFGYVDAQMIKAQLESAGIPVLLGGSGTRLGFVVGDLGAVPVLVPTNMRDEALAIVQNNQ